MSSSSLTTVLICLPLGAALALWALPMSRFATGSLALLVSLVEVGLWIEQAARFDYGASGLQNAQQTPWIKELNVSYHVGEYGFSLFLVGLTVVAMAAAIGYGFWVGRDRPRAYYGLMLFLTGVTVGVFVAQDLLLFYAFFEAMLIPLYVLVGVWGGAGRLGATLKLLLYTMAGSLVMLAAIVVYGLKYGTFDLVTGPVSASRWLFLGFMMAFLIKAPLFPFHGWLPDSYREAPPEVTAVLSGVIAKAGLYGMLRIAITKFPEPTSFYRTTIMALAAATLVYASVLAFRSPDFRGVVLYSSMAASGLIALGLFSGTNLGYDGAVLQMIAHGLISVSLFLIAGTIERRTTSDQFAFLGGMARGRPALATLLMATGVISLAVPGSAAFAGEFLILGGAYQRAWWWAVIGATGIVLAAMYMLRLISAVLHQARGSMVTRRGDGPPARRARADRPARRRAAGAVALAGRDQQPLVRERPAGEGRPGAVPVIATPHVDWFAISTIIVLLGASFVALLCAVLVPRAWRRTVASKVAALGFLGGIVTSVWLYVDTPDGHRVIANSFYRDRWTALAQVVLCAIGFVTTMISVEHIPGRRRGADPSRRDDHIAEFFALLLASTAGMTFIVGAANLMGLFLSLEWFSLALYIMCAIDYDLEGSLEAGLKYLIVGSFGSASLLFGSALVYGATNQIGFVEIAQQVEKLGLSHDVLLVLGLAMIISGLGFKVSAAPFHMWTPDVYEGAPTPVTAFMAAATKVAALFLAVRVLNVAFPQERYLWTWAFAGIAVASLVIGNLAALGQKQREADARVLVGGAGRASC